MFFANFKHRNFLLLNDNSCPQWLVASVFVLFLMRFN